MLSRAAMLLGVLAGAACAAAAPKGLNSSDWSSIRQEYERHRQAAFPVEGGHRARNLAQQWTTRFDGRGFEITPDSGGWRWGLEFQSYGMAGQERKVAKRARVTTNVERVSYRWNATIEEWYVNGGHGLEHGFTIARPVGRPTGSAAGTSNTLQLRLAVRGNLLAEGSGRGVRFVDRSGATVLNYTGLKVTDAGGRELPARMAAEEGGLRFEIEDSGAQYPISIDPIVQQAYLKASNTDADAFFGESVAVSGDTVVVGAHGESSQGTGSESGAAYVFVRSGNTWSQQAYLKASNADGFDYFGKSVAVSGNTVVVGAYGESSNATGVNGGQGNNSSIQAGAAYVFVRSGTTWSQQAYLKASNTGADDHFGYSVSVSGDTVIVGAPRESSNATGVNGDQSNNLTGLSGAAYVFVRNGTAWSQQAYLKSSNTGVLGLFGFVAVSGDTAVVGAPGESVNGDFSGSAYVFVRNGTTWSQQTFLKGSNTGGGDGFGDSVAVSGDTVVVGAAVESNNATGVNGDQTNHLAPRSGAAYVFVRSGAAWSQQAYLKASNTEAGDAFGVSVGVSGDTVVVGASGESSNATAVNGDQSNNSAAASGAAYVFVRSGTTWSQQAYLKASNTEAGDAFGLSVAISGNTVVSGAFAESSNAAGVNGNQTNNSASASGAAYVFVLPSSAALLPLDTSTQGNWKGVYGTDGYLIANEANNPPAYLTVPPGGLFTGASTYTWVANSSDGRALQKAASATGRIGSAFTARDSFTIDLPFKDSLTHQVALYLLDLDTFDRSEIITFLDPASNAVLSTHSFANFHNGTWAIWNIQGPVRIQVSRTGGLNAVVSGLFFKTLTSVSRPTVSINSPFANQQVAGTLLLSASATAANVPGSSIVSVQFQLDGNNLGPAVTTGSPYTFSWASPLTNNGPHTLVAVATDSFSQTTSSAPVTFTVNNQLLTSAVFVRSDTTTQGNWQGHYGGEGQIIALESTSPPNYAAVSFAGAQQFQWALTADQRALQKVNSATQRIASAYYGNPSFSLDVNLTDGNTHQVALYFVDWDSGGRAETVTILDASTQAMLDAPRQVSSFAGGQYLVWNLKGHVSIQFTRNAGANAVVNGVFFAPTGP